MNKLEKILDFEKILKMSLTFIRETSQISHAEDKQIAKSVSRSSSDVIFSLPG